MLKIWWIWKIEIWCEQLVYGYQTDQPNNTKQFPTYFNPNKFPAFNYTLNFAPIHVYPRLNDWVLQSFLDIYIQNFWVI